MPDRGRPLFGSCESRVWLPYCCVSTNLSLARTAVHRRGQLAQAVLASSAIPGVLPAVPIGDDLHVDGGLLDNVPVQAIRSIGSGPIIAVDCSPRRHHRWGFEPGRRPNPWEAARSLARPSRQAYPNILRILEPSLWCQALPNHNEIRRA